MSDPAYTSVPLEQRLVNAAVAWLEGEDDIMAAMTLKERDADAPITPKTETPKKLRLIVSATDEGRAVDYAPIRNIRLSLIIRGNAMTDAGDAEGMHEAGALIERLLDDNNLLTALDSADLGVRVMLAVRRPGAGLAREGMIRMQRYDIECKCVAAERCS